MSELVEKKRAEWAALADSLTDVSDKRRDAVRKYGPPDGGNHVTRYSDSSFYDEICVLCGLTDDALRLGGANIYNQTCSET